MGDSATKEFDIRLLAEIDERRESGSEEGVGAAKKPLVDYDGWEVIEGCLYRDERVRDLLVEGEVRGENAPRW